MTNVAAQERSRPQAIFTQEELDQLLAPIALHPDALLTHMLMASSATQEVVQAVRFIESRPDLTGDALARAIAPMPWTPSVKSLTHFPSALAMMQDKPEWTRRLGAAFTAQQEKVLATVQRLRVRAQRAGNLRSTAEQRIVQRDQTIFIEPADPQIIYLPFYNPAMVYGRWWWPQRPPIYWAPPRYHPPHVKVTANAGIFFGAGVGSVQVGYRASRPDLRWQDVPRNPVRFSQDDIAAHVLGVIAAGNRAPDDSVSRLASAGSSCDAMIVAGASTPKRRTSTE